MTRRSEQISLHLNAYLTAHSTPPDAILRELATETAERYPNEAGLQVAPEMGAFLTLMTRVSRARSGIEVGTFTGYSSICIARGLGPGAVRLWDARTGRLLRRLGDPDLRPERPSGRRAGRRQIEDRRGCAGAGGEHQRERAGAPRRQAISNWPPDSAHYCPARYSGSDRPACRIIQMGVRSTASRRHARKNKLDIYFLLY